MHPTPQVLELVRRFPDARVVDYGPAGREPSGELLDLPNLGEYISVAPEQADRIDGCLHVVNLAGSSDMDGLVRQIEYWYARLTEGGALLIDAEGHEAAHSPVRRACQAFCGPRGLVFYVSEGTAFIHRPYAHLEAFKDKHKGQRCFIIGNGPSLSENDLDLIADDHAIAMNCIPLLYGQTIWRPSYYVYSSVNVDDPNWGEAWQQSVTEAVACPKTTSFIWRRFAHAVHKPGNIVWLDSITLQPIGGEGSFSTNMAQYMSKTGTTMNLAFQMAYYMGFDPIIVIGADLNFVTTTGTDGKEDPNHFDGRYVVRINDGGKEREQMRTTHVIAQEVFRRAGREIYNATSKTFLDVYPLVTYEKVARDPSWRGAGRDERSLAIFRKRARMSWYWKVQRPRERRRVARLKARRNRPPRPSLLRRVARKGKNGYHRARGLARWIVKGR